MNVNHGVLTSMRTGLPSLLKTSVIMSSAVVTCSLGYVALNPEKKLMQWTVVLKVNKCWQLNSYHRIPRA